MSEMDQIRVVLERNKDAIASAAELIERLVAKNRECVASGNTEALKKFLDELDANTNVLATAVVKGTPLDPSNQ